MKYKGPFALGTYRPLAEMLSFGIVQEVFTLPNALTGVGLCSDASEAEFPTTTRDLAYKLIS